MDRSAWELGFEGAAEMYPDSPVEDQPDIWIVRRIQPKYNPRLVNRKGTPEDPYLAYFTLSRMV